ncbi:MAG: trypsin-like peptidase domain-containing protein [Alphaproteobacteria bacterium]|nr:trypsin-like peptidase domain-containing protein [Alphaproteobacteria bacterium]MCB9692593.1 trypsin-like peptidase domain-containing protein [Alphaproteobacteria bacterium]
MAPRGAAAPEAPLNPRLPAPLWLVLAALLGLVVGIASQRMGAPRAEPEPTADVATVFDRVRPSVVDVRVPGDREKLGAGVVVGPLEVVTARHLVFDAAGPLEVRAHDGTLQQARVVGTDARSDLALLAIDRPLEPARMGNAGRVRVGDTVLAVGNPFGLSHSLSVGVVGAKDRRLQAGGGPRVGFLQLSIPLNPGNSGGPIFNLEGELVGLLTGTHTEGQGIGFAVPTDVVAEAMPDLRAGRHVSRGFLGIRADDTERGVEVVSTIPTGPADVAGLQPGDLVTGFDDVDIGRTTDLYDRLDALPGGHRTHIRLLRDGQLQVLEVELSDWASQPVVIAGMTLRPLAGSGGRVVAIRPRSRASRAGVQLDDVVRTVDGLPMYAPADVRTALSTATSGSLGLERQGRALQVPI